MWLVLLACGEPVVVHGASLGDSTFEVRQTVHDSQNGPPPDMPQPDLPEAGEVMWRPPVHGEGTEMFLFDNGVLSGFVGTYDDVTPMLNEVRFANGKAHEKSNAFGMGEVWMWHGPRGELAITKASGIQTAMLLPLSVPSWRLPVFTASYCLLLGVAAFGMFQGQRRLQGLLARRRRIETREDLGDFKDVAKQTMLAVLAIHTCILGGGGLFIAGVYWGGFGFVSWLVMMGWCVLIFGQSMVAHGLEKRVHTLPASEELRGERDRVVRVWKRRPLPDW